MVAATQLKVVFKVTTTTTASDVVHESDHQQLCNNMTKKSPTLSSITLPVIFDYVMFLRSGLVG
jgi:hypothetical protein